MSMTNLMICLFLCYSVLSATTGSFFAAEREGIRPAIVVSRIETRMMIMAERGERFAIAEIIG